MNHARGDALRSAVGLALFLIASPGLGQQTAHFVTTADSVLIDERFRVALDGLELRQEVTIRVDGNRGMWQSSATLRSDDRGHVEVADPMRLIWSATGDRPGAPVAGPWTFTAETDGRAIATHTSSDAPSPRTFASFRSGSEVWSALLTIHPQPDAFLR